MRATRIGLISVHTCPLAALGGRETGGMNVYIREVARHLGRLGLEVDVFTRSQTPGVPEIVPLGPGARVVHVVAGPQQPLTVARLWRGRALPHFDEILDRAFQEDVVPPSGVQRFDVHLAVMIRDLPPAPVFVVAFMLFYLLTFAIGAAIVVAFGADLVTGISGTAALIGNVGPGFGVVGPMGSFADLHPVSKVVLTLEMWIGRLEVLTVLVLLQPEIWRTARWRS